LIYEDDRITGFRRIYMIMLLRISIGLIKTVILLICENASDF
jgi:hypothetical protein